MFNNGIMDADVAIEIIAEMMANNLATLENETDEAKIKEMTEMRNLYRKQREEIYSGNKETIEYVIEVYGKILKSQR